MAGQGYTPSLGAGATVLPNPTTYTNYSINTGATVQLAWPVDNFPANANVVAQLMSITPLGAGCFLQMPAATFTSTGEKSLIFNAGSSTFTVIDSQGNTIVAIAPGIAIFVALTTNATTAGTWLTFTFGAGTSSASAAALAGAGLAANGQLLQQIMQVVSLSTNYSPQASDRDNLLNWTGGSGTITLPVANAVGNNYYFQLRNSGSGTLTISTQGSDQINGGTTLSFPIGYSAFIVSDGTNWWTVGLGIINATVFTFQIVSLAGQTGTYVLPSNQQGFVAYKFTGALAGNTNIQVPSTVAQYWVDNVTTGGFTLGIGTSTQISGATQFTITNAATFILYCDGTNVLNAVSGGIGIPLAVSQGGTGSTTASGALTNLGGTSVGTAVFTAANQAAAISAIGTISEEDARVWGLIF